MIRRMFTRIVLAALLLTGCGSMTSAPIVHQFETNDYKFEYDGEQKRTTIGPGLMRMSRHPGRHRRLAGDALRVGDRDYGTVAHNDKISVVGGKVAVNGQERRASGP